MTECRAYHWTTLDDLPTPKLQPPLRRIGPIGRPLMEFMATLFPPDPSRVNEPGYLESEVELLRGSRVISLGVGTAPGINDATVVGGLSIVEHTCDNPRRTYAVEWINGTLHPLGNGISYDVSRRNQTIGDNE